MTHYPTRSGLRRSSSGTALVLIAALVAALLASVAQAPPAFATALEVNTTLDVSDPNDGLCSLREAIEAADADAASGPAVGECPAGFGTDTISFAVGGTFTLTQVDGVAGVTLRAGSPMTIDGSTAPAPVTIDAGQGGRVFSLRQAVTIQDVTMTGGEIADSGGGGVVVAFDGVATLLRVAVTGNQTTGDTTARGGGIAVSGAGQLTLIDSTVSGNTSASFGGGISASSPTGVVNIINSTISGNTSLSGGSGGLFAVAGVWTISFSTISDNTGDGGAGMTGNSGVTLEASIVADNNGVDINGDVSSGGFNVVGGNLNNALPSDIELATGVVDALADNGGPTLTHLPVDGSAAIGNVTGAVPNQDVGFDQRGVVRPPGSKDAGAVQASTCVDPSFTDVPSGAFFEDAVLWAACLGITTGTSATAFSPGDPLTRAQMATFLWRYAGEQTGAPAHGFVDVPSGAFFDVPVAFLKDEGITTGTSATTFSPNDTVTRAQMAAFLWRLEDEPAATPHAFLDVPLGAYFDSAVGWMSERGITTGTSATTFSPDATLTRAQAVTFLWRLAMAPPG